MSTSCCNHNLPKLPREILSSLTIMARPSIQCPLCSKMFANNAKFKAHIVNVHTVEKAHKCNLCSKEFSRRSKLNLHVVHVHEGLPYTKKKTFQCNVCGYGIGTEKQFINHMRKHSGERPFKCTIDGCEMTFKLELTLKNHIKSMHSDERPFKCKFRACPYRAKTTSNLIAHMKVHSDFKPFACPHAGCGYRSTSRSHMKRHVAGSHAKIKPFACSKCDYKAAQKYQLKYHMHRHTTKRDFKCTHPQCTESFKTGRDLNLHFTNRHGDRNVECDHPGCGRKYGNTNALYKHKWDVHSKKRLGCPNRSCSYSTNKPRELAAHVIFHDGRDKNIVCSKEGCEYRGKNSRHLELHMRRHETLLRCPVSGCSSYTFTKDGLADHAKVHNPFDRPFQCSLCSKHYKTRDQLRSHTVQHAQEKPFSCGHCDFASFWRANLQTHISKVHENIKFPVIILPFDERECLYCKVTLPFADFIVHSMGHAMPVVVIERLVICKDGG